MSSQIILRGQEFVLDTLDVAIVVSPKVVAVTISAMSDYSEGGTDRLFAHTHLVDRDGSGLPSELDDLIRPAVQAFKSALNDQGGVIVGGDES